jgi:CHAP domain
MTALLASAAALCVAGPAAAAAGYGTGNSGWVNYYANPTNTATWSAFCAGGGGSKTLTVPGIPVPACGPTGGTDIDIPLAYPYTAGGETYTPGFQCVELTDRYMYVTRHWGALDGDGADVARIYGAAHGMTPVHNGTAGQAPQVGDVISFSVESNFTNDGGNYPGHTAIVSATNVNSSGNGSITIMSENYGDPETATTTALSVSDWSVQAIQTFGSGGLVTTPYIEWLPLGGGTAPAGGVHATAWDPGNNSMYVAAEGPNHSLIVYWNTPAINNAWVSKTIGQAYAAPALAWNPGSKTMDVVAEGPSDSLVLYQTTSATSITWTGKTIGQSDNAPALAWNPGNNSMYAAVQGASNALVLYWNTPAINNDWPSKTIGQADNAPALAWNPGNNSMYAAVQGTGNSLVLYWNTPAVNGAWVNKTIGQAYAAPALAWNPGNNSFYAAVQGAGNSLVLYWNTPAINNAWVNKTIGQV